MCIVAVKKKGIPMLSKNTIKTCFENNPDGAGFMYVENGYVVIKKGYMGYRQLYKDIKETINRLGDINIVIHFRIGTSGNKDAKTTHPYPISTHKKDLQALSIRTNLGVVHNGVISGYIDITDRELNDTQVFIRDVISVFESLNKEFYKNIHCIGLLDEMTKSKLCFLNSQDELYYVGDFITDENGVLFSNSTYKPYTCVARNWQYYDDGYNIKPYNSPSSGLIDEIDFFNYTMLNKGDYVGGIYDKSFAKEITIDNMYAIDSLGNFCYAYGGAPTSICKRNCEAFDENGDLISV